MTAFWIKSERRRGHSLLELVAVATVLAIIAALVMLRYSLTDGATIKKDACAVQARDIELQAKLWYRTKGVWPATNLSDIAADARFFPRGLPTCPVNGSAYTLDATTHTISGHTH